MSKKKLHEIIQYENILEHISDAVAITGIDSNGHLSKILDANSMAIKIFGYTKEELLDKYLSDFEIATSSKEQIQLMENKKKLILKNGKLEFEMTSLHKNGQTRLIKVKAILINDTEDKAFLIHFINDITEKKKFEEDLKQSKEEFKIMFENTPIATWYEDYTKVFKYFDELRRNGVKDLKNYLDIYPKELIKFTKLVEVINLNKAALEIYDTKSPKELLSSFDVKFNESLYNTFKQALLSVWVGNEHGEYESQIITFTGNEKHVIINYKKLPSLNKKSIKYLITMKDVSEQKKIEEARIRNHSLNALGEMASSVAHDFNNSLQSILGNLEILIYNKNHSTKTLEILESIKKATLDAANRIKLVRRFNNKKENSDYDLISMENLIDDTLIQSRPMLKDIPQKTGILIEIVKNYNNSKLILGNSSELRSVIYNILKNSVEAMPKGGIINISTFSKLNNVEIIINDTGKGMDKKVINKIFQPFYTTKGFELGRGLGMSGAYHIMKEHKGLISVESSLGKGTSIKIEIPISTENNKKVNSKVSSEFNLESSKKLNILWVDDEEMIRDIAGKYIKLINQNGKTAKDGLEALQLLKKENYDLVITDIGMPNMNGWQLIAEIKKLYQNKIKIIVVTGWGSNVPENSKLNKLFYASLQKPIQFKDLKKIIDSI